jgi:electron transfer flavoprotein beta subunit
MERFMNIVCCLKQVPDTAQIKIDPETNTLIRAGVESILNPYDLVALEQAVRLKETHGGKVTAISMGPPQAQSVLRQALSMGADRGILLSDRAFAGADTLATSYTLTMAIDKIASESPVDLILCGKQAIDGDTAQTGPGIATRMKITQLTYVSKVQWLNPEKKEIQVVRKLDKGTEVIRGKLPALLTVELDLVKPRRAGLPALIHSLTAPVDVWDAEDISAVKNMVGIKGSPTWVRKISSPPSKEGGPKYYADPDPDQAVSEFLDILLANDPFSSKVLKQ